MSNPETKWIKAQCGTGGRSSCERNGKAARSDRENCRICGQKLVWLGEVPFTRVKINE